MQRQGIVGSSFSLSKGQKIFGLVLVCMDEEQSGTYILIKADYLLFLWQYRVK